MYAVQRVDVDRLVTPYGVIGLRCILTLMETLGNSRLISTVINLFQCCRAFILSPTVGRILGSNTSECGKRCKYWSVKTLI